MKKFIFAFFTLILCTFSCNKKAAIIDPVSSPLLIKGSIELPFDFDNTAITIISGSSKALVKKNGARTAAGTFSGIYELDLPTDKTSTVIAIDNKTEEIICLQTYNPLEKVLKLNVKTAVDFYIKEHPLLMTNNPQYDKEFNNILASLGGINSLYTEVEENYKKLNVISNLPSLDKIFPLVTVTKLAKIWKEIEEKFFINYGSYIKDYRDASIRNTLIATDKSSMKFQMVNPLNRHLAYSISKGKNNEEPIKDSDSISDFEFISPNTEITNGLIQDWFWKWKFDNNQTIEIKPTVLDKTINTKDFDFVNINLYGLGRKGITTSNVSLNDQALFAAIVIRNGLDLGFSLIEGWTNIGNSKREMENVFNGVGRDKKDAGKALYKSFEAFLDKKGVLKKMIGNYINGEPVISVSFINEFSQYFIEFIKEDQNFKWVTDALQEKFGKEATKVPIQLMGKTLTKLNQVYYSYQVLQTTISVSEKVDAFLTGNLVQNFQYILNPNKLPTTDLVAYYSFDGDFKDKSGKNNFGVGYGGIEFIANRKGVANRAIMLGGYFDPGYVKIDNSPTLTFNKNQTISIWYKLNSYEGMDGYGNLSNNGYHVMVGKEGDRDGFYIGIGNDIENSLQNVNFNNNTNFSGDFSVIAIPQGSNISNLEKWIHIVTVVNGKSASIFIDGKLNKTIETDSYFNSSNDKDLYLGTMWALGTYWYPFNGALDDVRIYNRALSIDEIKALYAE